MPAWAITAVTILLIERTDSCSPVREIHTGPLVMLGLLWWPARSASHSCSAARAGRLSGTMRRRSPLPWRITSRAVRNLVELCEGGFWGRGEVVVVPRTSRFRIELTAEQRR